MYKRLILFIAVIIIAGKIPLISRGETVTFDSSDEMILYEEICGYVFEKLDRFETDFSFQLKGDSLGKYTYEQLLNNETEYEGNLIDFYIKSGHNDYNAVNIRKYTVSKSVTSAEQGGIADSMVIGFTVTYDQTLEDKQQATEFARKTARHLTSGMTADYDKALVLHNFLVDTYKYDMAENGAEPVYTAPDMIEKGKGVCSAYATLYSLLLDSVGVKNKIVFIDAFGINNEENTPHAWNMVNLDGLWYHVDVTWDDPVNPNGLPQSIDKYLFVSDSEIAKDHRFDKLFYPKAPLNYGDSEADESEVFVNISNVTDSGDPEPLNIKLPTALLGFFVYDFKFRLVNSGVLMAVLPTMSAFILIAGIVYIIKRYRRKRGLKTHRK